MAVFATKITELELMRIFLDEHITLHNLDISKTEQNCICFIVDNKIAALASVNSDIQTGNNLTQYGINIYHISRPEVRLKFNRLNFNKSKPLFTNSKEELTFIKYVEQTPTHLHYYLINAEELYDLQYKKSKKDAKKESKLESKNKLQALDSSKKNSNITEPHLKAQYILKEIANIIDTDAFIAKNDQTKIFNSYHLSEDTLLEFPNFEITRELKNHLSLIDVIWFNQGTPVAAFEVETTTSIYSGMLRLADLICSIGNDNVNLYIVTTRNRINKIKKELNRPIFQTIGLSSQIRIIFIDDLEKIYDLIKLLRGHIKNNILDKISYHYDELLLPNKNNKELDAVAQIRN